MIRAIVFVVALLIVAGVAGAQTPPADQGSGDIVPGNPAAGRQIAQQRCATCHSIAGTRTSPVRAAPRFSQLGRRFQIDSLGEALAEAEIGVRPHQSVQMPEFVLEPQEIEDLLAYLRSIQR